MAQVHDGRDDRLPTVGEALEGHLGSDPLRKPAPTTDAWLATLDHSPTHVSHDDALAAVDAAREEPAPRDG
jgi:hypothetical protein